MHVSQLFRLLTVSGAILVSSAMFVATVDRPKTGATAAAADQPRGAVAAVGELPSDIDILLAVEDAQGLRRTPIGLGVLTFMKDTGALNDIVEAWSGLARELGWSEEETFDRLLGGRAIFVARDGGAGAERRWALVSDVAADTQARLKERLKAAPRAIEGGRQILSVERGKFELASDTTGGRVGTDRPVTIVLGPAGKGELFDQVVRGLGERPTRPLGSTSAFAQAAKAGPAEVVFLSRLRSGAGRPEPRASADDWTDYLILAGRRAPAVAGEDQGDARSWLSRVIVRESDRSAELKALPVSSDAPFEALRRDAILTMVQAAPLSDVLGAGSPVQMLMGSLPLPEEARPLLSGRQALVVREIPGPAGADQPGRVSATLAVETTDVPKVAGIMDSAIARTVQTLEQRFGLSAPPPRDFRGVAPGAARVLTLAGGDTSPLRMFSSRPLAIAWVYPSPENEAGAAGRRGGWWAFNIAQTTPDAMSPAGGSFGDALTQDAQALVLNGPERTQGRWVLLATVQTKQLESMLPGALPDVRDIRSFMRRFERLGVRLGITPEGDIQGDIDVRLAESPAR